MLSHPFLSSHNNQSDKIKSAKVLAHSNLIAVSKLQVDWDEAIVSVLQRTAPQRDDDVLWEQQISKITGSLRFGFLSSIPGDIHNGLLSHFIEETDLHIEAENLNRNDGAERNPEDDSDAEGETDNEDDQFDMIAALQIEVNLLENLTQASNVG
ncbi:hypothetical protein PtA15_2A109 [Puccinia triticina]|uniref:Uncharacterized protein n=1 Tax=Puccinia triticina TaxID=208348 RepID=A0ABY7CCZ8_9BASI|nr:uncharacterized protein PtA15_2A109 [Puccinia triticina]WAQ81797.1 hypothetical protein PtA15_2A109 [Puccinia triticina]WAR52684.1 hypothetical protein PtB15_2B108 [Puccinia triticina]